MTFAIANECAEAPHENERGESRSASWMPTTLRHSIRLRARVPARRRSRARPGRPRALSSGRSTGDASKAAPGSGCFRASSCCSPDIRPSTSSCTPPSSWPARTPMVTGIEACRRHGCSRGPARRGDDGNGRLEVHILVPKHRQVRSVEFVHVERTMRLPAPVCAAACRSHRWCAAARTPHVACGRPPRSPSCCRNRCSGACARSNALSEELARRFTPRHRHSTRGPR